MKNQVFQNKCALMGWEIRKPVERFFVLILTLCLFCLVSPVETCLGDEVKESGGKPENEVTFTISSFRVVGNTLLSDKAISTVLEPFQGAGKGVGDVEFARQALEKKYRAEGYPTVLVNVPDQNVEQGEVIFSVVEAKIRIVTVTGNRYYTMEKIYRDLPIFRPGKILYLPDAQAQLNKINLNPDLKVKPVLSPGKTQGTVDVELEVTDKLPLHGSLELNNRASNNTRDLRMNGVFHYDNLWQREHSISLQCQTSPEDTKEVQALSLSYLIHAPWNYSHMIACYGVLSDSEVAFGDDFHVRGKGSMCGIRYVVPLPPRERYYHNVTFGLDYKDFEDTLSYGDSTATRTPARYSPVSFKYQGILSFDKARTSFNASVNMVPRGIAMDQDSVEEKRYKSRANYLYLNAGAEHAMQLPAGFGLNLKTECQIADQPLISNEQYSTGGMEGVRGYKESEVSGDNAAFVSVEIASPEIFQLFRTGDKEEIGKYKARPFIFYDFACLRIRDPLPGEEQPGSVSGTGIGLRGFLTSRLVYECDWGIALDRTDSTEPGDFEWYVRGKYQF